MNAPATAPKVVLPPKKLITAVKRCLNESLVPIVRSSPGMGKSDIIRQIAAAANLKVIDCRVGQADITDFNGLPNFGKDGKSYYVPFDTFPLKGEKLPINEEGQPYNGWLLFFDEITSAPKQIQAAAFKVLLERAIGHNELHERVWMACAGNLDTDNAVVHSMSTPMQSRLVHLELVANKNDWIDWAISEGIDSRILAYIEFKPSQLHNFNPDHQDHTYPCPRTWSFANKLIQGKPEITMDEDLALLAGTLSYGTAIEFINFCQIFESLPKIPDIIADPIGIAIPYEPSTRYAIAVMLVDHFDQQNAGALMKYALRLPVEARVLCLRMIAQRKPQLIAHPAMADAMKTLVRM